MLKMRNKCEKCGAELPLDSEKAFICSFECTFCLNCTENDLHFKCPNCEGLLTRRPTRIGES